MSLKYALNRKRTNFRVAVVVSRKVSGSAVVRTRIRRRVYGSVEKLADRINASYDLIFSVYSQDLADIPTTELYRLVENLLDQAGVLNKAKD